METSNEKKLEIGFSDLIGIFLSLYVLVVLLLDGFFNLSKETQKLLEHIDVFVCLFFFTDFSLGLIKAKKANKLAEDPELTIKQYLEPINFPN